MRKSILEKTTAELAREKEHEIVEQLRQKRRRLLLDAKSMEEQADKLADEAESSSNLTLLAKSNALRKGTKAKKDSIAKIDEDIANHMKTP